jgi:hypothetical protein
MHRSRNAELENIGRHNGHRWIIAAEDIVRPLAGTKTISTEGRRGRGGKILAWTAFSATSASSCDYLFDAARFAQILPISIADQRIIVPISARRRHLRLRHNTPQRPLPIQPYRSYSTANPNGISSSSPGLSASGGLPWDIVPRHHPNPERVESLPGRINPKHSARHIECRTVRATCETRLGT